MASFLIPGSRFYLPRPYDGPDELLFQRLYGGGLLVDASEVSCFEMYKWPGTLTACVVIHLQNGVSHVLSDSQEAVREKLTSSGRRVEPSL